MGNYIYEVYTRNEITLEEGWYIIVGNVRCANNRDEAIDQLKRYFGRYFDCVISCCESGYVDFGCRQTDI